MRSYAEEVLKHIDKLAGDIEVIEVSVQPDHIHMVIVILPRIAVSSVIQYIKTTNGGCPHFLYTTRKRVMDKNLVVKWI